MPDSILAEDAEPQPTIEEDIERRTLAGTKAVSRWGAKSYVGEFTSLGKDEVVSALTFSSGSKTLHSTERRRSTSHERPLTKIFLRQPRLLQPLLQLLR